MVQLSDELQLVIDRQVAEGRAVSQTAFLEQAIRHLIDENEREEDELFEVVEAGSAEIEAGRYTDVATPEDRRRVEDGLMARLGARLSVSD